MKPFRMKGYVLMSILAISMFSTSCISIAEEFFFRKDGSGTASMVIDMKELMDMMKMMGGMAPAEEGGDAEDPMAKFDEMFEDEGLMDSFKEIPGISNVVNMSSKDRGTFGYKFEFANEEALNTAMGRGNGTSSIPGMSAGGDGGPSSKISIKKNLISRVMTTIEMSDEDKENLEMAKMMMGDASWSTTYKFEQNIKKVTAKKATIENQDKNSVTLKVSMLGVMDHTEDLNTSIKLK